METGLKSELPLAMSCLCQEYSTEMANLMNIFIKERLYVEKRRSVKTK